MGDTGDGHEEQSEPDVSFWPQRKETWLWMALGTAVVAVLIVVALVLGQWLASPSRSALSDCRLEIKRQLVAPSTAHFHDGYVNGQNAYWMVDAENSFGARLTHEFKCTPGRFGQLTVQDLNAPQ